MQSQNTRIPMLPLAKATVPQKWKGPSQRLGQYALDPKAETVEQFLARKGKIKKCPERTVLATPQRRIRKKDRARGGTLAESTNTSIYVIEVKDGLDMVPQPWVAKKLQVRQFNATIG